MGRERALGFLQLLGSNVITKACWAVTIAVLVRKLGVESFGVLATLWSASNIASGFTDLGTGQVLLREASRDLSQARNMASRAARIQLTVTISVAIILAIGAWYLLPIPQLTPAQRAFVIVFNILTPLIDRFSALFTVYSQLGKRYATYANLRSLGFITLLVAVIFLPKDSGLVEISAIYFALTTSFLILIAQKTKALLPKQEAADRASSLTATVAQGLPFLSIMTLALAYGRIEVSMLGACGYTAIAGAYHVIYQLVLLVYSICGIFFTIVYPRLYSHRGNKTAMLSDLRDTVRWLSLLAVFAVLPLFLFAEPILQLLGGTELVVYAPLLRTFDIVVLIAPASAALNFLMPLDLLRSRIICDATGVGLTAIGSWIAIARGFPWLVVVANVIGYGGAVLIAQVILRKTMPGAGVILLKELASATARAIPAMLIAWLLSDEWWMRCLIFAVGYGLFLIITYRPILRRFKAWL